jgi:hypothetical protein
MKPGLRKAMLTAHVATSIGWFGAAVAYAGLATSALLREDPRVVRAAYLALPPITWFAVVPLALASLVTGIIQSLGTPWGLLRHYWVIYKLVLSVAATTILLLNTETVSALALQASGADAVEDTGLLGQLVHASLGMLVLLLATVLAVFKPRGVTRYGWRKQHALVRNSDLIEDGTRVSAR